MNFISALLQRRTLLNQRTGRKPHLASPPRAALDALPILRNHLGTAFASPYVMPRVRAERSGTVLHLDRAARECQRAVVTGASGMGKSSALRYLATRQGDHTGFDLRSLDDFHPNALPRNFASDALILLDDATPAHTGYLTQLAQQFPRARIWVAAREKMELPDVVTLSLQPLNEREIISFAEGWFPLPPAKGHSAPRVNRAAEAFVASVQADAGTRILATTPLYLFLLLQIYHEQPRENHMVQGTAALKVEQLSTSGTSGTSLGAVPPKGWGGNRHPGALRSAVTSPTASPFDVPVRTVVSPLPTHRTELFDAYVRAKLETENDPDFALRALEGIALSTKRGQIAKEEHLARGYGFLRARAWGRVEFIHPLLQDFLAARALRRNPDSAPLRAFLPDENWRDVVLFYAGLDNPSEVIQTLLDSGQTEFAAYALAESASPPPDLAKRVTEPLVQRAWEQNDHTAVASLGALRSNSATDFFSAKLKERDPANRARAARILGQLQTARAVDYLLPQLRDTNADVRDQVVASLGQSKSERVVEPLLVALRGDPRVGTVDTRMRVAAANALGEIGTDKAVPALIVEIQVGEPEVRAVAVEALIKIRSELARKPLAAIVNSNLEDEVRAAAQQVLTAMEGH